ncbi:DUF4190 domain-containing protein [Tsukamurella pseudospumae]|nr:DUF4190 domain-containing protein [Tsukamurella pseudospumae]
MITLATAVMPNASGFVGAAVIGSCMIVAGFIIVSRRLPKAYLVLIPVAVVVALLVPLFVATHFNMSSPWPVDLLNDFGIQPAITFPVTVLVVAGLGCLAAGRFPAVPKPIIEGDTPRIGQPVIVGHTPDGQPVYAPVHGGIASQRTNSMAIVALVLGVAGGVLAIPFGHIALSQIKRTGEQGRGMAIAGLVLGYLSLVAVVAMIIFVIAAANGAV